VERELDAKVDFRFLFTSVTKAIAVSGLIFGPPVARQMPSEDVTY
jgi:hypothetical protein